jgi:hypothetical protein
VKRLGQLLMLAQLLLVVGIGMRLVEVVRVAPPVFEEPEQAPARIDLPPPPPRKAVAPAVTDAIVDGNLFEVERGVIPDLGEDISVDDIVEDVPPPTTVILHGVMNFGDEAVALLTDTNLGPQQRQLRTGDLLGDYEVGEIKDRSVQLMAAGGQQFQVALQLNLGGGGAAPVRGAAAGRATPPRATGARQAPGGDDDDDSVNRASQAARNAQRTMSARERAQAAQRAAANRRAQMQGDDEEADGGEDKPDPVQARLEALKRLREAARNR